MKCSYSALSMIKTSASLNDIAHDQNLSRASSRSRDLVVWVVRVLTDVWERPEETRDDVWLGVLLWWERNAKRGMPQGPAERRHQGMLSARLPWCGLASCFLVYLFVFSMLTCWFVCLLDWSLFVCWLICLLQFTVCLFFAWMLA